MPSDPGIILAAGNIQGPQPQDVMSAFGFAQQIRQMQRQEQGQNALRQIFTNPNSIDPKTNLPTPEAIRGIMQVDPDMGIKMQDASLDALVRKAQLQHYQTDAGKNNFDFMSSVAGIGVKAYDDAKKAGKSDADAVAAGQSARNDAVRNNGGIIGDDVADGIIAKPFDPSGAKALASVNPDFVRAQHDAATEDIMRVNAGIPVPGVNVPAAGGAPSPSPDLIEIIPKLERSGDDAVSPAGAVGRYQIMPDTARQYGFDPAKLKDPEYSKGAAQAVLADLTKKYDGNRDDVLAAYNWGPAKVDKWIADGRDPAKMPKETRDYLARANALESPQAGAGPPIIGGTGWQILTDPTTNTQYRYNPKTLAATTLDGRPYKPGGAAHLGGGNDNEKGWKVLTDAKNNHQYRYNAGTGESTELDGTTPYKPSGVGNAPTFTPEMGGLMAALAEQGVSIPAGFRSKQQQAQLFQGLLDRNPGKTPDEIAHLVKVGQIEFGAQKKETQTAAGVAGKVEVAQNEIKEFAPLVRAASAQVPRGSFVPLNKLMQMGDSQISDPHLKTLKIYINSLLNAYDMLAARGGTDKDKRGEVRNLLLSADGPEALNAALTAFTAEADAAHRAAVAATHVSELENPAPGKPAKPAAAPASPTGGVKAVGNKGEYDALPRGAHYSKPGDQPGSYRVKQ